MTQNLFNPEFFRKLERVRFHFFKGREEKGANAMAPWESGEGLEFHDYRGYAAGDDLRYLDWNAYARLGKTFLKRFRKEEGTRLTLLLDVSFSMRLGRPSKLDCAKLIAGGLGVVAFGLGARVDLRFSSGLSRGQVFEGRDSMAAFLKILEASKEQGISLDVLRALDKVEKIAKRQEIFFLSDGLDLEPAMERLRHLRCKGHEVNFIQILGSAEMDPPWDGDCVLVDSETGERKNLSLALPVKENYRRRFDSFLEFLDRFAKKHGIKMTRVYAEEPFEDSLLRIFASRTRQG